MQGRHCGVTDRVKVLMPPGGQIYERHSAINRFAVALPAIHRYSMPSQRESRRELFGKCFKAPVPGWDPARANDRDAGRCFQPRTALERETEVREDLGALVFGAGRLTGS